MTLSLEDALNLDNSSCVDIIRTAKRELNDQLLILAHHYQREEVFEHADVTGDSLKLARHAAASKARYLVFCGVHFMAEVADILSRPEQTAILPNLEAGCSMADMADLKSVERSWQELAEALGEGQITPVTYINSSAALKAFCGDRGGIVCTSGNARAILEWALKQRSKVLFFPDQHLGRNTGAAMGFSAESMLLLDTNKPGGGFGIEQLRKAKLLLWPGYCSVHQLFRPEQIANFRARFPEGKVIVHPECAAEVCYQADEVGSTEAIIAAVHKSPPGSRWLVGTELNLVNRLREQCAIQNKRIHFLAPNLAMCATMFRIDQQHLAWVLDNLREGVVVNRIKVSEPEASKARLALQLMLDVSGQLP